MSQQQQPSSTLHNLARVFNWQAVIARSATHPKEASYLGPDRLNALHHICNRRPGFEVVRALVEADSSQCDVQDVKGWTPLHYCCRFKANVAAVKCLIEATQCNHKNDLNHHNDDIDIHNHHNMKVSSAIRSRDFKGRTPLYYAVRYEAPDEVVRMLVLAYPDAVTQRDHQGVSPISFIWNSFASSFIGRRYIQEAILVLSRMQSSEERRKYQMKEKLMRKWKLVTDTLKLAWKASHHRDFSTCNSSDEHDETLNDVWLPLHALSACTCHVSLFQVAVALYPEQVSVVDESTGRLPLHCVAASPDIPSEDCLIMIQKLLEIYPEATQVLDIWGRSPLSLAAHDKVWTDGVSDLYESYQDAIRIADIEGKLPIHIVAKSDCAHPMTVMQIIEKYPEGLQQADNEGKLPLHLSVESLPDDFQNKYLMIYEAYPDAIKIADTQDGWIPLHSACANPDTTSTVIRGLLSFKNGAKVLDRNKKTPFMIAAENGKSWENTLRFLFDVYPDAIKIRDVNGFLPIHALAVMATDEISSQCHLKILSTMFQLSKLDPSCYDQHHGR